jgi:hypothetical protein
MFIAYIIHEAGNTEMVPYPPRKCRNIDILGEVGYHAPKF